MKQLSHIISWLLFYVFITSLLTANAFYYLDPDFGWHLRVGEHIALSASVPHDQIYMWTLTGQSWVDHEWLSNLLTYELWQLGGYPAVTLFFVLLIVATIFIINKYVFTQYLKKAEEQFVFAGLEIFALIGCLPHFGVRMQEFYFLTTALLFIIIDRYRREQNIKIILWLIPLLYLWACLHGGFLFGVAVSIGWLVYEIGLTYIPKLKNILNEKNSTPKQLAQITLIVLVALATTLVTPYYLELYTFLSDYASNRYYLSHIQEWRTPFSAPFAYSQIIYNLFMVGLGLAVWLSSKKRLALWQLTLSVGLLFLASRSIRHFPLFALSSLLFIGPLLISEILRDITIAKRWLYSVLAMICLALLSAGLIYETRLIKEPFIDYCEQHPCGAVAFLKNHPELQPLRLFNDYGWGGYLIATMPEQRLFIDGRLPQYPFNGKTMLEEYSRFFDKKNIENVIREHGIELILFKASEKPFKPDWLEQYLLNEKPLERHNPLLEYLAKSPQWKKIYSDQVSVIYQKIK